MYTLVKRWTLFNGAFILLRQPELRARNLTYIDLEPCRGVETYTHTHIHAHTRRHTDILLAQTRNTHLEEKDAPKRRTKVSGVFLITCLSLSLSQAGRKFSKRGERKTNVCRRRKSLFFVFVKGVILPFDFFICRALSPSLSLSDHSLSLSLCGNLLFAVPLHRAALGICVASSSGRRQDKRKRSWIRCPKTHQVNLHVFCRRCCDNANIQLLLTQLSFGPAHFC